MTQEQDQNQDQEIQSTFRVYNVVDVSELFKGPRGSSFLQYIQTNQSGITLTEPDFLAGVRLATSMTHLHVGVTTGSDDESAMVHVPWAVFDDWLRVATEFDMDATMTKANETLRDRGLVILQADPLTDAFGFVEGFGIRYAVCYGENPNDPEASWYEPDEELTSDEHNANVSAITGALNLASGTLVYVRCIKGYIAK